MLWTEQLIVWSLRTFRCQYVLRNLFKKISHSVASIVFILCVVMAEKWWHKAQERLENKLCLFAWQGYPRWPGIVVEPMGMSVTGATTKYNPSAQNPPKARRRVLHF